MATHLPSPSANSSTHPKVTGGRILSSVLHRETSSWPQRLRQMEGLSRISVLSFLLRGAYFSCPGASPARRPAPFGVVVRFALAVRELQRCSPGSGPEKRCL